MRNNRGYWTAALAVMLAFAALPDLAAQERGARERAEREAQRRGWLGLAFSNDEDNPRRVVVVDVLPNSPADRAGVEEGDVLVRLNGRPVTQETMRSLQLSPGDEVRLHLERDGREREITVVAAERLRVAGSVRPVPPRVRVVPPREPRAGHSEQRGNDRIIIVNGDTVRFQLDSLMVRADSLHRHLRTFFADSLGPQLRMLERELPNVRFRMNGDSLIFLERDSMIIRDRPGRTYAFDLDLGQRSVAGAEFTPLNPDLGEYFEAREGLLVLRVAPETPADRAGLQAGDVVTAVNGTRVRTVSELRRAVTRAGRSEDRVRLEIVRKGRARELRLR